MRLWLMFWLVAEATFLRRGAFDFGSGYIQLRVVEVRLSELRTIYTERVELEMDPGSASEFSPYLLGEAVELVKLLKKEAEIYGRATVFRGVATAAYRKMSNGPELVAKYAALGVPTRIISQQEEGRLAWLATAKEIDSLPFGPSFAPTPSLVTWDLGADSFQITYQVPIPEFTGFGGVGEFRVYTGPWGRRSIVDEIGRLCNGQLPPGGCLSEGVFRGTEWVQITDHIAKLLPPVPQELKVLLLQETTRLVGTGSHPKPFWEQGYTIHDLLILVRGRLLPPSGGDVLPPSGGGEDVTLPELALIYVVMQQLGVSQVHYLDLEAGLTLGLLDAPEYWR